MLGVLPFIFPNRQGLDQHSGFQQDVEGNVLQVELSVEKVSARSPQENRQVGVAIRTMTVPRPATEEDGLAILGAPPFAEDRLCSVVAAYQAATDYHLQRPPEPSTAPMVSARSFGALRISLEELEWEDSKTPWD